MKGPAKKFKLLFPVAVTTCLLLFILNSFEFGELATTFSRFNSKTFLFCSLLFTLNIFVVSARIQKILSIFGERLPFQIMLRATLSSFIGSIFLGSFYGQTFGRQIALRNNGILPDTIATVSLLEKILTTLIGGLLCLSGSLWIFGESELLGWVQTSNLITLAFTITACLAMISIIDAHKNKHNPFFGVPICTEKISGWLKILGIACLSQIITFSAFIMIIADTTTNIDIFDVLAATAIIAFASSLPISINGWGIREVASISILGNIGIPATTALAISLSVGICSTISFVFLLPYLLKKPTQTPAEKKLASRKKSERKTLFLDYLIISLTCVLILAQVTIKPFSVSFSFNLADPFVMMYLVSSVILAIETKNLPRWSVPNLNLYMALFTLLLIFALLRGYIDIGFTEWAFYGRGLGWPVLLAYMLFGYFVVYRLRHIGLIRVTRVLLISLATIIVVRAWIQPLLFSETLTSSLTSLSPFSGLVMNRNAFAFQLLICSALYLGFAPNYNSNKARGLACRTASRFTFLDVMHGLVLFGIYLTGSRAGLLTWLLVISGFTLAGIIETKRVLPSFGVAVAIVLFNKFLPVFMQSLPVFMQSELTQELALLKPIFSGVGGDALRWRTILHGIEMWASDPILGVGLGVFFEKSAMYFGENVVIHSTPVWIIAEMGLVGFILLLVVAFNTFRAAFICNIKQPKAICTALILTHFLVFGLVHEIFYQRIFWFAIGVCLAAPSSTQVYHKIRKKL